MQPKRNNLPECSIIIPMLNEAENLPRLIRCLRRLKGSCEVIFVDGGSTDGSRNLVPADYILLETSPGRAHQMNEGLKIARGAVVWFIHCDTGFRADALQSVLKGVRKNPAGCFRLRFRSRHPWMRLIGICSNLRVRWRNIAFGDQGLFFRTDFLKTFGGFPALPLMEDYELSIRLKEAGIRWNLLTDCITTSDIRFRRNGYIKTTWKMQRWQADYRRHRGDAKDIAEAYTGF